MQYCNRSFLSCWLLLGLLSGCISTKKEDEPHEEVHFPPHWPTTVFVAADRIDSIRRSDGTIQTTTASLEEELIDLVQWLPELMADSDLKEADFHKIDTWASRWVVSAKRSREGGANWKSLVEIEGFGESIDHLLQICKVEQSRLDALEGK